MIAAALAQHLQGLSSQVCPQVLDSPKDGGISYSIDGDDDQHLVDGGVSTLREALIAIDCWNMDYMTAIALADSVESSLVGYTGSFGDHHLDHCRKERRIDLFENDTRLHRVSFQFFLAYY